MITLSKTFLLLSLNLSLWSATINIISPTSDESFKEGDNFFLTEMNNRLDFDKRRDIMWEENFDENSISIDSNIWSGTFSDTGAYIFPLFQGFPLALNTGLIGANYPIDTTKYNLVTILSKIDNRTTKALHWSREVNWPDGTYKYVPDADGYYTNTQLIKHGSNEWVLDYYDLSSKSDWTGSNVKGLRIDSSTGAPSGTNVEYKWIRISDPASTDKMILTWSTTGVPSSSTGQIPQVNVYIDSDNSGYDGAFFKRVNYSDGSLEIPMAALEPGTYYIYLKLFNNIDSDTLLAQSSYSYKITINAKPKIEFESPSMTSGADYATQVLNDSWDMENSNDVANIDRIIGEKNFQNESFTNGIFSAEAIIVDPSNQRESDSQIWLNINSDIPVDTSKYQYLTYTMKINETGYGNISDKVGNDGGWISRIVWWNEGINVDGSATKGNIVYEGINTYQIDLTKSDILAPDDSYPAQTGWKGNGSIKHLRLDPTETIKDTIFYLYDVKLTAKPRSNSNGIFDIVFSLSDNESEASSVMFYKDTNNENYDGSLISNNSYSIGEHTISIDTTSWENGEYYIYAVVVDSFGNISKKYSDVPVVIGVDPSLTTWSNWFAVDSKETPMVGDFNGDGKTDIITFTRDNPNAIGDVYVSLSDGSKFGYNTKWSDWFAINSNEEVVIGDFDGDGYDDIATWLKDNTKQIYVALSYGSGMYESHNWLDSLGFNSSDLLFTGDANGDGRDDLILFARELGKVYVAKSYGSGFYPPEIWHNFFAVSTYERPRVGDINGDGKVDIITFASDSPSAQGDVYVAISDGNHFGDSYNSTKWHDWFGVQQKEIIKVGDRDGDGKDDFFTFMTPPSGQVYNVLSRGTSMGDNIEYNSSGIATLSTDLPFLGDANGDGREDIIVFSQSEGKVHVRLSE